MPDAEAGADPQLETVAGAAGDTAVPPRGSDSVAADAANAEAADTEHVEADRAAQPVDRAGVVDGGPGEQAPAGATTTEPTANPANGPSTASAPPLWRSALIYTVLRFGLLFTLAFLLQFLVPLVVALALAVVLQLPLAMVLFAKQRADLSAAMAPRWSRRHDERARLRAELHGD